MVFLLLAACSGSSDGDPFFSSSGRYDQPGWGTDTATDTAGTDTGGDTASEGDPGAPVFTDITGAWDDYLDLGRVLLVKASYTDEGDDLAGGTCYIDAFYGDASTNFDTTAGTEPTDGCIAASGTFVFALADLDTSIDTRVEFAAQDQSRNLSALYTVEVAGE